MTSRPVRGARPAAPSVLSMLGSLMLSLPGPLRAPDSLGYRVSAPAHSDQVALGLSPVGARPRWDLVPSAWPGSDFARFERRLEEPSPEKASFAAVEDVGRLPGEVLAAVERDHLPGHGAGADDETDGVRDLIRARTAPEEQRGALALEILGRLAGARERRSRADGVDAHLRRQRL